MDAKPQNAAREALIQRNDAARRAVAGHWQSFCHRIDVPARISENIRQNRKAWFAGSAVLGLFMSGWFRKSAPSKPVAPPGSRKGLIGLALGAAITLAKPALKTWLLHELQSRLQSRFSSPRPSRPNRFTSDA